MKWLCPILLLSYHSLSVMAGCTSKGDLSFCFHSICRGHWSCRQVDDCSFGYPCDSYCVSTGRKCSDIEEEGQCRSYADCKWEGASMPTLSPTAAPVPMTSPTKGDFDCVEASSSYKAEFADLNPSCECKTDPDTDVEFFTCRDSLSCERCNNGVCGQFLKNAGDPGDSWNQYQFNNDDGFLVWLYLQSDDGTGENFDKCRLRIQDEQDCDECSILLDDNGSRCMIANCFNTEYNRKYGGSTVDTCNGEEDLLGPLKYFGNGIGESFEIGCSSANPDCECKGSTGEGMVPTMSPTAVVGPSGEAETFPTMSPTQEDPGCAVATSSYRADFADLNPSCECGTDPETDVEFFTCRDALSCERCNNGVCGQFWKTVYGHGGSWNQYRFNNDDGFLVYLYLQSDDGAGDNFDKCRLRIQDEQDCDECSILLDDNGNRCMIANCFNTEYNRKYGGSTVDTCNGEEDLLGPLKYFGNGIGESFEIGCSNATRSSATRTMFGAIVIFSVLAFLFH